MNENNERISQDICHMKPEGYKGKRDACGCNGVNPAVVHTSFCKHSEPEEQIEMGIFIYLTIFLLFGLPAILILFYI